MSVIFFTSYLAVHNTEACMCVHIEKLYEFRPSV